MKLGYPRSFLSLLLLGFAIVIAPLIAGLIVNVYAIEQLSQKSQKAVYDSNQATRLSRELARALVTMERAARFYAVSPDNDFLRTYRDGRAQFQALLTQLNAIKLDTAQSTQFSDIVAKDEAVAKLIDGGVNAESAKALESAFNDIDTGIRRLSTLATQAIDREVEELRGYAVRSRNQALWQMIAVVPIVLLIIGGFTFLLTRPIRELDLAIHRLGEGNLADPVAVRGPRDIRMLGEQLDWLRQRLITLESQKTRFFQHVSHELKTPLTALREGSDLLRDEVVGKLNGDQREIVSILRHNSLTLEKLIQDLLAYSARTDADGEKNLARKIALDIKPIRLMELIESVIETQKIAIVAKAITIQKECDRTLVQGDGEKLRVIIDNLISNAIKYSPAQSTVRIRLSRPNQNAVIEVIDQGPGITDEDRDRIFDPFFRGRAATTTGAKGTGLGLAIVKDYVDMHHGSIRTVAAKGAHFRVVIPAKHDANL